MRGCFLRPALTVTATLALAACTAPIDTELDIEADPGHAEEQETRHVLPLPHTEALRFFGVKEVGPFDLPQGASLTVVVSVTGDRPACTKKPFFLEPARARAILGMYTDALEPRPVAPDGAKHREQWTALEAGRYVVDVDQQRRDPTCTFVGTITISSP